MDKAEIAKLESYLGRLLGAPGLKVRALGGDEAEVLVGDQKIADLSKDEDEGDYNFSMAILDIDL